MGGSKKLTDILCPPAFSSHLLIISMNSSDLISSQNLPLLQSGLRDQIGSVEFVKLKMIRGYNWMD